MRRMEVRVRAAASRPRLSPLCPSMYSPPATAPDSEGVHAMKSLRPALTLCAIVLTAALAHAQAPDFTKVEIKATKVTDKFYTLEGQGGTIGVLVGPDGVFMV